MLHTSNCMVHALHLLQLTHINQTLPQIIHFCLVVSLLNYAPDVVNCMESQLFSNHKYSVMNV